MFYTITSTCDQKKESSHLHFYLLCDEFHLAEDLEDLYARCAVYIHITKCSDPISLLDEFVDPTQTLGNIYLYFRLPWCMVIAFQVPLLSDPISVA